MTDAEDVAAQLRIHTGGLSTAEIAAVTAVVAAAVDDLVEQQTPKRNGITASRWRNGAATVHRGLDVPSGLWTNFPR